MEKTAAVASLGAASLLAPSRVRAALTANDRLKLGLTVLQTAAAHADAPATPAPDLAREIAAAGLAGSSDAPWLNALPGAAERVGSTLHLAALTHGRREAGDSLHLLVMDLHKALNQLAARLATELVDGAHTWQLAEGEAGQQDRARIAAFMRGIARTRAAKLDHPGLDTAATRDGARLLIQNDIGTNDAHVLVLQVEDRVTTLTYSDLHRQRFAFFQGLLAELGAHWGAVQARRAEGLNDGQDYQVGIARFEAADEPQLLAQLEGLAARIVFLIDWNRARKRLLPFIDKAGAVSVLTEAARRGCGHMAWLAAGGERLLWQAMAEQGSGSFHLGDRLDEVMGAEPTRALLLQVLVLAADAAQRQQPMALVADETRLLLARALHGRHTELALLQEHAGLVHALAQALRDGLAHGAHRDPEAANALATRAKAWERQADHLVMRSREQAERSPQWQPLVVLIERSDDVADALEEAAFLISLIADGHFHGWGQRCRDALQALADAVLGATQDHVKALAVALTFGDASEAADHDEFVAATWRGLQAERRCDELLRSARRALAHELKDAAALMLATDLASALESASDGLLALVYGLRARSFRRVEAGA
ncbi:MAG: phosphate transport regulator [Pseudomonas sp. PGPPP3]|nr:MAG: phosphate transport regulator [Pseudomonas sp. PGPPP3]